MPDELIRSRKNPRVQRLKKLHEGKGRRREGVFLVEGLRVVEAALEAGAPLEEAWISPRLGRAGAGLRLAEVLRETPGLEVVEAADEVLEAACSTPSHQGVVATCRLPEGLRVPPASSGRDLVVLADLQDPGNLGTIWRSAAAAGIGLLVQGDRGADPFAPKTVRSAAGVCFRLPVLRRAVDMAFLEGLREDGYRLLGAAAWGEAEYHEACWDAPVALLIGQEGPGLPDEYLDLCHQTLRIPMAPGVESLNAAVSASLLMYELARARDFCTMGPSVVGQSPSTR